MEVEEKLEQAAARELFEETRVEVDPANLHLFAVGSLPEISEVYVVFRGEVDSLDAEPTEEASEARFVAELDVPWSKMAYPDINGSVHRFFSDQRRGDFKVYQSSYVDGQFSMIPVARK